MDISPAAAALVIEAKLPGASIEKIAAMVEEHGPDVSAEAILELVQQLSKLAARVPKSKRRSRLGTR